MRYIFTCCQLFACKIMSCSLNRQITSMSEEPATRTLGKMILPGAHSTAMYCVVDVVVAVVAGMPTDKEYSTFAQTPNIHAKFPRAMCKRSENYIIHATQLSKTKVTATSNRRDTHSSTLCRENTHTHNETGCVCSCGRREVTILHHRKIDGHQHK